MKSEYHYRSDGGDVGVYQKTIKESDGHYLETYLDSVSHSGSYENDSVKCEKYIMHDYSSLDYNVKFDGADSWSIGWDLNLPKINVQKREQRRSPGYVTFDLGNGKSGQVKLHYDSDDSRSAEFIGDQSKYKDMYVGYAYTDSTSGNINDEPTLVIVDEGFYLFFQFT